jgi:hypothetical protein
VNENNPILDSLQSALTPDTIQQFSQQLGADPASVSKATNLALPMLLGGLSQNASNPQGAAALDRALDDHDGSILGNLGGLLGGGGAGGGLGDLLGGGAGGGGGLGDLLGGGSGGGGGLGGMLGGAAGGGIGGAILGHIFGAKRSRVEDGVSQASGLNGGQVAQLLMMLAPIVMGVLGRMKKSGTVNAEQLPQVLEQGRSAAQRQAPEAGGLAGMLDQNNDGNVMDDIARMGAGIFGARKS